MEAGDIVKIPRVYDKLFFKSYLKALGLNETQYYSEFLNYRDQIRQDKTTVVVQDLSEEPSVESRQISIKSIILTVTPVLIVAIVIWILVANTRSVVSDSGGKIEPIDIRKVVADSTLLSDTTRQKSNNEANAAKITERLNLNVKASQTTWFRVVIDQSDTLEYTLPAGNTLNLEARKSYQFLIGKANGIHVALNSNDLGQLGEEGEVVQYLYIDSTGIVAKKNVFPKNKGSNVLSD